MREKTAVLRWGSWWYCSHELIITRSQSERRSLGMAFMQSELPRPGGMSPDPCDVSVHDDQPVLLGKQSRTRTLTVH